MSGQVESIKDGALTFHRCVAPVPTVHVVLVAVLDDGCAFLNERLRRPRPERLHPADLATRQDRAAPAARRTVLDEGRSFFRWFTCRCRDRAGRHSSTSTGRQPSRTELRSRPSRRHRRAPQRTDGYRAAGYLDPTPQWTHGQVVLDVAVGAAGSARVPRPQARRATPPISSSCSCRGRRSQTPPEARSTAMRSMRCSTRRCKGSVGVARSGGHQSQLRRLRKAARRHVLFERAAERLLDSPVGRTMELVLPAGNSHLLRTHAGGTLPANRPDSTATLARSGRLHWREHDAVWLPLGNDVEIKITAPDGSGPFQLLPRKRRHGWSATRSAARGAGQSVADSLALTMVFIGVSPTRRLAESVAVAVVPPWGATPPPAWAGHRPGCGRSSS